MTPPAGPEPRTPRAPDAGSGLCAETRLHSPARRSQCTAGAIFPDPSQFLRAPFSGGPSSWRRLRPATFTPRAAAALVRRPGVAGGRGEGALRSRLRYGEEAWTPGEGGTTGTAPRVAIAAFKPSAPPPLPGPGAGGGAGEERNPGNRHALPPAGRPVKAAQVWAECRTCPNPLRQHLGRGGAKVQRRPLKREGK